MATSNAYSWLAPDPFKSPTPPIWKEKIIGEVQFYYKNVLRPRWIKINLLSTFYRKIDPSGENIIFAPTRTITEISGLVPRVNRQITVSGFVSNSRIVSSGSQLRSADASWAGAYCKRLKETREFVEAFYGQAWSWIAPSSQASLYNLNINEIVVGGTKFYSQPPHADYIRFLREVPDAGPYNFTGSTADHSSMNIEYSNASGTVQRWHPTSPAIAPHLAREQGISVYFSESHPNTVEPATLSLLGADGEFSIGQGGFKDRTFVVSKNTQLEWNVELQLPLYKRTASTLPTSQGLLLNTENTSLPGLKGLKLGGPIIASGMKIKLDTLSEGLPETTATSLNSLNIERIREWVLNLETAYYNEGTDSVVIANDSYLFNERQFNTWDNLGNPLNSSSPLITSSPVGKFTTFNFTGELNILEDFPSLEGRALRSIILSTRQRTLIGNGTFFGGGNGGSHAFKRQYVKGLEVKI